MAFSRCDLPVRPRIALAIEPVDLDRPVRLVDEDDLERTSIGIRRGWRFVARGVPGERRQGLVARTRLLGEARRSQAAERGESVCVLLLRGEVRPLVRIGLDVVELLVAAHVVDIAPALGTEPEAARCAEVGHRDVRPVPVRVREERDEGRAVVVRPGGQAAELQ